jgi:hypothetical protein
MSDGTKEKPKQANPNSDYINKGIQDLENHANQGNSKSPGGIRGRVGKQLEGQVPGGKALNALRKGNVTEAARSFGKDGAKELGKLAVKAAIANPEVSIPVGIVILLILLVVFLIVGNDSTNSDNPAAATNPCTAAGAAGAPPDTLTVQNAGPTTAKVGDTLTYHITVADTQQDQEIVIIEHLPDGVSMATGDITSNWQKMTVDPTQKTITWKASENLPAANGAAPAAVAQPAGNNPPANNPPAAGASTTASNLPTANFTIDLTLKATTDNTNLVVYADVNPTRNGGSTNTNTGSVNTPPGVVPQLAGNSGCPGSGSDTSGGTGSGTPDATGYLAPSIDNCGGKYKFTSPLAKNFGDPSCSFNKDQAYTLLKQDDPTNADTWFNKIMPCESGYNPNAYAGPQTGTPDARGAWGLVQMGSASPPGSPPPATGKNGPNDRGDVNWQTQIANATTYGKKISSLGAYWACAR